MRISDWSSDVCSSDLLAEQGRAPTAAPPAHILGRHPAREQPARGAAPFGEIARHREDDLPHNANANCSGGGAKRARRSALSVSLPGRQSGVTMKGSNFLTDAVDRKSTRLNSSH